MPVRALLCSQCGFGSAQKNCVVCGDRGEAPAYICDKCGSRSKADRCFSCDRSFAKIPAMVCREHRGKCVICGRDL